ncbi:MAG TPA: hypothetical protein VLA91_12365 [Acidimicrobiia bacterium]|nr:hypothetical protein [Acidimicrobiia bacterium]
MTYDDRERERLRRGLAVLVEETPVAPELATLRATPLHKTPRLATPARVFVTAAAAVMVTVGGVALLQTQGSNTSPAAGETAPSTSSVAAPTTSEMAPTTSEAVPAIAAGELPYVISSAPGWTITFVAGSSRDQVDGSGEHQYLTIVFGNGSSEAELNVELGSDVEGRITDREAGRTRLDEATLWGTSAVVSRGDSDLDHSAIWAVDDVVFELRATLDEPTFRSLLGSLTVVDREEWIASVPDTVVTDRPAAVTEYLADIPLPAGFDATSLQSGPEVDRYFVGADVVAAVTCAWIEQWVAAKADQDQAGIDQAVDAMATSREWDILNDMATEGDFSLVVFEYADAIAGDGTVVGGRVLTVEESYRQAFGCP